MFTDPERFGGDCAAGGRRCKCLYAGKAHPQDEPGKALIQKLLPDAANILTARSKLSTWKNYAWDLGAC